MNQRITEKDRRLFAAYQSGDLLIGEIAQRTGRTKKSVQNLLSRHGYSRTKKAEWPQAKIETLIWLNETQAPYGEIAKVMEWWGWGKITARQVNSKLCRLRKKGYEIERR